MKERWQQLTKVQKGTVLTLAVLAVIFAVVYLVNAPKEGMFYGDDFLFCTQSGQERTYTGRSEGAEVTFTANGDTVTSWWGGETHVYTVKKDPAAVPKDQDMVPFEMEGVEVREGDKVLFRGGWDAHYEVCYSEDGEIDSGLFTVRTSIDPPKREPAVGTVLSLWQGPELSPRVDGLYYFLGLLMALLGTLYLFFADELFRWDLWWRVKDPYGAEPSDWELLSRTIGGAVLTLAALFLWGAGFFVH